MSIMKPTPDTACFASDQAFNKLYPLRIQMLAQQHWSSIDISRKAAIFLAGERNVSILDIGSGVGKFCLIGAHETPGAYYYGVEQREALVTHANKAKNTLGLENVSFLHGNFTQLDLREYDHFYFYNAFYENISDLDKIDDNIAYSLELFNYYNRYLYKQLEQKAAGTRLCTLCSMESEIPSSYHLVGAEMNQLLKFWIKI
jgi:SAM-dependent methyltransferase